ncbi:cytochrome c [Niveibacterium sp. 24ML]|uniref:c-type cytochrome n=1 Tax=Niveibacterium sp. 24ML TaxID=2985512 RepID=UPI00226F656A|nr:cytochrome c [Niveibacterium sp. 24ML]MCX9156129.1 cytochrome c [Niveibacterium sp. 24ML]
MRRTKGLLVTALLCASGAALAVQGNPDAGRKKVAMCLGCHGIADYKTTFPTVYHVPKLGGQHPEYLVRALQAYKSGERSHPSMKGLAEALSDQDMADIAAFFGAQK